MAKPTIEPIEQDSLAAFAHFLSCHMGVPRSPDDWVRDLSNGWYAPRPNYGYLLRDDGKIVGGIGALYSRRLFAGTEHKVCNITSWCVLDSHRQHSMRLALQLTADESWSFTDFSPTRVVAEVLKFLKFQTLPDEYVLAVNLPTVSRAARVIEGRDALMSALAGQDREDFLAHERFPWLRHVAIESSRGTCYVVYKIKRIKRLGSARILHVSNREVFSSAFGALSAHFTYRGLFTTQFERRWINAMPRRAWLRTGFNPKVYRSSTLGPDRLDYLYCETTAMDL